MRSLVTRFGKKFWLLLDGAFPAAFIYILGLQRMPSDVSIVQANVFVILCTLLGILLVFLVATCRNKSKNIWERLAYWAITPFIVLIVVAGGRFQSGLTAVGLILGSVGLTVSLFGLQVKRESKHQEPGN